MMKNLKKKLIRTETTVEIYYQWLVKTVPSNVMAINFISSVNKIYFNFFKSLRCLQGTFFNTEKIASLFFWCTLMLSQKRAKLW